MTLESTQERFLAQPEPQTDTTRSLETVPTLSHASLSSAPLIIPGARELHWFTQNRSSIVAAYRGKWIAISGETILGCADTAKDAYEEAKSRGFPDVAIVQVPESVGEWDNLIF